MLVNELPLYIANGVTGIRVMSGEKDTAAYRAELARQQPSPEIYLASAIVDAIWLQGRYFDQAALAQLLETAKQAAKH